MTDQEKKEYIKDLYYNKLKFCGCGRPGRVLRLLRIYLKCSKYWYDDDSKSSTWVGRTEKRIGENMFMLLAHLCDSVNLTTHGGSVHYCWPEEEGYKCLEALTYVKGDIDGLED